MPRRRRKRRQRLERQEQRQEATDAGVPVKEEAPAPEPTATGSGFSFSGAVGAILATVTLSASAVLFVIDEDGALVDALLLALSSLFFVPAIIVSLIPGNARRQSVLRITTIGCLGITVLLSLSVDNGILLLMMLPTALLAFGAGFIFQGSRSKA